MEGIGKAGFCQPCRVNRAGGSYLPSPAAQQSPQGQQNFCLRKDWRAGMSRGSKPDQREVYMW